MSQEDDWVREQLASLPDPPLPDDVRRRLDAAIAAESARTASPAEPASIPAQSRGGRHRHTGSTGTKGRRALLGMLGAAAAVVLIAVINPFSGTVSPPGDQGAALAPPTGQQEQSATGTEAPPSSSAPDPAPTGASDSGGEPFAGMVLASDTAYAGTTMASQAAALAASTSAEPAPQSGSADGLPASWSGGGTWSAATLEGVASCIAGLPGGPQNVVLVDRATFEGQPALVVLRRIGDRLEVFAQDASCTATDPAIELRATVEAP